jgi:hypothetical protein
MTQCVYSHSTIVSCGTEGIRFLPTYSLAMEHPMVAFYLDFVPVNQRLTEDKSAFA